MQRSIGRTNILVNSIGLGAMPLSIQGRPEEDEALQVIFAALDAGVDFIDTADVYCLDDSDIGHNERLIARALQERGESARMRVATKGGLARPGGAWVSKADPEHLQEACEASLRNLGVESIFLYQLHAPDERVPFADSLGALVRLQHAGKIQQIGLSNITVPYLEQAEKIARIESVQNRCNLFFKRDFENGLIEACAKRGITFIPHSPLGGWRNHAKMLKHAGLKRLSAERDASPYRVALAWLLHKGENILPIPGASKPASIRDSVRAAELSLSPEEISMIDKWEDF